MIPRASIIIPVYNAENTLRHCVESLVFGKEQNIEIILCEDCSQDNSWNLCCELANNYENIKCVRNSKNSGVSFTRNVGLSEASGQYILFVDSDDWASEDYVKDLIDLALSFNDSLPMCSYQFIDKINNTEYNYQWRNAFDSAVVIPSANFFKILDKNLLKQLWNKIFRHDLIEKYHIRFDVNQNMGEDFQFVLDYIELAEIRTCVVYNKPLYYYIRWHKNSLMQDFGFTDQQYEFARIEQLSKICGNTSEKHIIERIERIKNSYVYHIVRNKTHSKQEKLDTIERIMHDGRPRVHYRKQRILQAKEMIAKIFQMTKC